ncbi:MAG: Uma2 family endonuclease, partial [Sphaerospermopsis kisseleviana]
MIQTLNKIVTFEEFINWLPENSDIRYELHHGEIVTMGQPVGDHEEVKGFLTIKISAKIDGLNLPYVIPNQVIVRPEGKDSGYFPDLLVLNRANLANEPLWKKQSVISHGASIPLIVEVVSNNWRDDYHLKYADYEEMGIAVTVLPANVENLTLTGTATINGTGNTGNNVITGNSANNIEAALRISQLGWVVTTSGSATGVAPSLSKLST